MGYNLYNKYDYIQKLYSRASSILGYDLTKVCFTENELLNQTIYTQPAMLITEVALYHVLKNEYNINPVVLSGFSLGEYAALYASGAFSFDDIFKLIDTRSKAMHEDSLLCNGKMAAVIGLDIDEVKSATSLVDGVYVANHNSNDQIVISYSINKEDEIISILKEKKARRVIPLNVSGAFHSPYMNNASKKVSDLLENIKQSPFQTDVILNVDASVATFASLKEKMRDQIIKPVLFHDTILKLINDYDIDTIIEVGPGNVLTNLIKKYNHNKNLINISDIDDFNKLM